MIHTRRGLIDVEKQVCRMSPQLRDEWRALEDIAGKILWFYSREICSEVDQLLAKGETLAM